MKRHTHIKMIVATALVATVIAGGLAVHSFAQEARQFKQRGEFLERFQALGVTDDQKAQIKEILRQHQPAIQPLVDQLVTERRALREVIRAEQLNESAIRAQSAKVAAIEADLAVARAHVAQDLRQVLTADQIAQLQEIQADAYERIDNLRAHVRQRIAE